MTIERALADLRAGAAKIGATAIEPLVRGSAPEKRYLHANVDLPYDNGLRFRLKIANQAHPDYRAIRSCCRNANSVHVGLCTERPELPFLIPRVRQLPEACNSDLYVVELLKGQSVSVDSPEHRQRLVNALLNLELATQPWDRTPFAKPKWIHSCPREGYRDHIVSSLQGVLGLDQVDREALLRRSLHVFGQAWDLGDLHSGRCFCHGDFSRGNVLECGGELALIDFEHAHVGAPGLDLAHLYVNLRFDARHADAEDLRERYLSARAARGLGSAPGTFKALVIERMVGKWNAMKVPAGDSWVRIRALLAEQLE